MLGIHRNDGNAFFRSQTVHQFTGAHQRFLVGQCQRFASLNGGNGGLQTGDTYGSIEHQIALCQCRHTADTFFAPADFGVRKVFQFFCQCAAGLFIKQCRHTGLDLQNLLFQGIGIASGSQSGYLIPPLGSHLQGLHTDGSG